MPVPHLPAGLRLDPRRAPARCRRPLRGAPAERLSVGDRVYFRHVKAGELCERFDRLYLVAGSDHPRRGPHLPGRGQGIRLMSRVPAVDPEAEKGPVMGFLAQAARLRPATWFLVNVGNRIDPLLMRVSGGRVKTTLIAPTVLLTHTGARSGKRRTTPLAYFTDEDDVVVIASRGGHEHNPAWLHNIRAHPDVELWSAGRGGPLPRPRSLRRRARAALAPRDRLLPRLRQLPGADRRARDPRRGLLAPGGLGPAGPSALAV